MAKKKLPAAFLKNIQKMKDKKKNTDEKKKKAPVKKPKKK